MLFSPAVGSALLPVVGFVLLPGVGFALLGSFHHRSRSSFTSRCPRTRVALLRSSLLFTTGSLAVVSSGLLYQSHFVVGYDSVACFWLPPTSLLSVAPFVIDGSR